MRYLKPRKRVFHLRGDGLDPWAGGSVEGVLYAQTRRSYVVLDAAARLSAERSMPLGHVEIPKANVLLLQVLS